MILLRHRGAQIVIEAHGLRVAFSLGFADRLTFARCFATQSET
jgi:recombinational DNA repair protein RecR